MSYNFNEWTYQDFNDYFHNTQAGDFVSANRLLAKVIPQYSEDDLNDLEISESARVKRDVSTELEEVIKAFDISDVTVDFKSAGWTDRVMNEFRNAQRSGNIPQVEKMLKEVAILDGVKLDKPLTFEQGVRMSRAVTEAYRKILSGE